MSWMYEVLARERQRELLAAAERGRLAATASRASKGSHLTVRLRRATAHLLAAARMRRRLA